MGCRLSKTGLPTLVRNHGLQHNVMFKTCKLRKYIGGRGGVAQDFGSSKFESLKFANVYKGKFESLKV